MTLEALEAWAPGARRGIPLHTVSLPAGIDDLVMAAGGAAGAASEAVLDADGLLRVRLTAEQPGTLRFVARAAVVDPVALWRPGSGAERSTLPPSWDAPRTARDLADIPVGCLVGRHDMSLVGFAVVASGRAVDIRAGMVEETGELLLEVHVEDAVEADVVLDLRHRPFAESVHDLGVAVGLRREPASGHDLMPVLCTWYSFHQDLVVADLLDDARIAAELGIGTVIIDDGWQTGDAARGYGSCGDWEVERRKIADPRELVGELDALGLRTLWWIGTPFIGHRSRTFQEAGVAIAYDEPGLDAAVLDPRSQRTRATLVERLRALLDDTGAHGFKIDFLERFAQDGDVAPADADHASIEQGALRLLDDIAALGESEPLMIEFREPYITAAALSRGTMFRVADCPLSPLRNRRGIVDLRVLAPGIAVHGDPIMWTTADSPERVAQQFIASLFGVPQISVRLAGLSQAHRETLAHWLGFWSTHAALLLQARLRVEGVDRDYAVVEASAGGVTVTVRYGEGAVALGDDDRREWHIVNGGESGLVVLGLDRWQGVAYEIHDARGRRVDDGCRTFAAVEQLAVPAGGRIVVLPRAE